MHQREDCNMMKFIRLKNVGEKLESSDEHVDRHKPFAVIPELENDVDVTKRKESSLWDFNEADGLWKWTKPPPPSKLLVQKVVIIKVGLLLMAGPSKVCQFVQNKDGPNKAFTKERAKSNGKANAASVMIIVTMPSDNFGPSGQGVLVVEIWEGRMECWQWIVHFPLVIGIVGQ
ncbi:hypothetical protein ACOSQ3_027245 [Xanthoceras sorbifolium]